VIPEFRRFRREKRTEDEDLLKIRVGDPFETVVENGQFIHYVQTRNERTDLIP